MFVYELRRLVLIIYRMKTRHSFPNLSFASLEKKEKGMYYFVDFSGIV